MILNLSQQPMKLITWHLALLLTLFLVTPFFVQAQEVDYQKIIPPVTSPSEDFSEKLVRLAWNNNPANKAIQANVAIAEDNVTLARWQWLERINISGNVNEFTLTGGPNEETRNRALFYPRYNIGISLSPGMIVQIPAKTRQAKQALTIANYNVNEQKLQTRKLVLQLYQDFLLSKQILEMETRMSESSTSGFQITEERFKRGQVMLEDYNQAAAAHIAQQRQRLVAESTYIRAKLELESLLGVKIEEVK